MPSSVKPNAVRETVPSLDGDFCEKFVGSLNAPALFRDWYKWKRKADGTLTDEFKAMFCAATAATGGDPVPPVVTPPVVIPPVDPPVNPPVQQLPSVFLVASRGLAAGVALQWTSSFGHTHYIVQRFGQTIAIVPATVLTGFDPVPVGRSYTYTVIAINQQNGLQSPPSNEAYGYTGSPFGGNPLIP